MLLLLLLLVVVLLVVVAAGESEYPCVGNSSFNRVRRGRVVASLIGVSLTAAVEVLFTSAAVRDKDTGGGGDPATV